MSLKPEDFYVSPRIAEAMKNAPPLNFHASWIEYRKFCAEHAEELQALQDRTIAAWNAYREEKYGKKQR